MPEPTKPGGVWEFVIPKWTPPSLNPGMGKHWGVTHALKKGVAEFLSTYAAIAAVPLTSWTYRPKRRLELNCVGWGGGETMPDPDNLLKFFLDAAVTARLLVDDSQDWCQWRTPLLQRGKPELTVIVLEDLELRPPINPEDDPVVKRFVGRIKARGKRRGQL